jgi:hypothetical protein
MICCDLGNNRNMGHVLRDELWPDHSGKICCDSGNICRDSGNILYDLL